MTRLFFLTLFFLTHIAAAQDSVRLSGKISNAVSDSVKISYNENRIAYYPKEFFAPLDDKGNFSLAFPVPHGIYVLADLVHGNKVAELVVQSGDSLVLSADASRFDSTIRYSGRGSEVANFVAKHRVEKGRMNLYAMKLKMAINKEPADFVKEIEAERKAEDVFLETNKTGLPISFLQFRDAFYRYYNYFFMQQYPMIREVIRLRRYTDTIPEKNYLAVKDMPYAFHDSLLQVPSYLLYLTGVFDIKLKAAGYGTYVDPRCVQKLHDSVTKLAYKRMPDKSAEYFIAQDIYGRTKRQEPAITEKQLKTFKKRWPNSEYTAGLEEQLAVAKRMAKGQPAPDLDLVTLDGKRMKLSDLRGKVVYLVFWASWCKQCVGEMPGSNRVKKLFRNKDVEFVYVSVDADTAAERRATEKYKPEGILTHAGNGWDAPELRLYGVQSLPAYFLIDKNGKLALQNAPSPAVPAQLGVEIGKLLK